MANWNQFAWSAGTLWGPAPAGAQFHRNKNKNKKNMKKLPFFPRLIEARPEWFGTYGTQLNALGVSILALAAPDVAASVADARYLEYCSGSWLAAVREFGPACTAALTVLYDQAAADPFVLPAFAPPPLPAANPPLPAVVAVAPGALQRIFAYVQIIKKQPTYTEAIGLQLGIVGSEDNTGHPLPEFTAKSELGDDCHCVRIKFKKFRHMGVAIYSRRGPNGAWEFLAIDTDSPYLDERELLVAGQPEVREYRMRFWDAGAENGEWTDVTSVTVGP